MRGRQPKGSGRLWDVLQGGAGTAFRPCDLTVLSQGNDPYRQGTDGGIQRAAWFAKGIERFVAYGSLHLRGIFYRIVASGNVLKLDGDRFINTEENWQYLLDAAKAARGLEFVPFEKIHDGRNEPPELFTDELDRRTPWCSISHGLEAEVPDLYEALPQFVRDAPEPRQRYRLVLLGEKSSLAEVLRPIARRFKTELLLPTGEITDTLIYGIAKRAAVDRRETVVLYFSDFDPAGYQMPISVSRKFQACRDLFFPDLQIELRPVALNVEQVRRLGLPSTPLKETELRSDDWRAAHDGLEQTEIDALLALAPDELERIAKEAITPFFDDTLKARTQEAESKWQRKVDALVAKHQGFADATADIARARTSLLEAATQFHDAQARAAKVLADIEPPKVEVPEADPPGGAPAPLFSTAMDFVTASRALIAYKGYAA